MALDTLDLDELTDGAWHLGSTALVSGSHQHDALVAIMRAVIAGQRRLRVVMATGTGLTAVLTECVTRLLLAGGVRRTLCVVDHRALAHQIHMMFDRSLFDVEILGGGPPSPVASVQIATFAYFTGRKGERLTAVEPGFYDLIVVPDLRDNVALQRLLEHIQPALVIGTSRSTSASIPPGFGPPAFTYRLHDALADVMSEPPEGYRELCLRDIATIQPRRRFRVTPGETTTTVAVVTGADIARQWEFPSELHSSVEVPKASLDQQRWLRPRDILIPTIQSTGTMHVGVIVPDDPPPAIAAWTVTVVRVFATDVSAKSVLDFLESNIGRRALALTGSTLRSEIRIDSLDQLVVHARRRRARRYAAQPRHRTDSDPTRRPPGPAPRRPRRAQRR
jgi:hypothetical protein